MSDGIKVISSPLLSPNTMVVSEDVFKVLNDLAAGLNSKTDFAERLLRYTELMNKMAPNR
jgi:hypothetical protein